MPVSDSIFTASVSDTPATPIPSHPHPGQAVRPTTTTWGLWLLFPFVSFSRACDDLAHRFVLRLVPAYAIATSVWPSAARLCQLRFPPKPPCLMDTESLTASFPTTLRPVPLILRTRRILGMTRYAGRSSLVAFCGVGGTSCTASAWHVPVHSFGGCFVDTKQIFSLQIWQNFSHQNCALDCGRVSRCDDLGDAQPCIANSFKLPGSASSNQQLEESRSGDVTETDLAELRRFLGAGPPAACMSYYARAVCGVPGAASAPQGARTVYVSTASCAFEQNRCGKN